MNQRLSTYDSKVLTALPAVTDSIYISNYSTTSYPPLNTLTNITGHERYRAVL